MRTLSVEIPEQLETFVNAGVLSGRFSSASEAVTESLRDLAEREREDQSKIEWMNAAVRKAIIGIEAGRFVRLHTPEEIDSFVDHVWESAMDDDLDEAAVA